MLTSLQSKFKCNDLAQHLLLLLPRVLRSVSLKVPILDMGTGQQCYPLWDMYRIDRARVH